MHRIVSALAIGAMAMAIAACGGDGAPANNGAPVKAPMIMRKAVPADFKDKAPPEGMDLTNPEVIAAGKALYEGVEAACATCHGMGGKGDGPAATKPPQPVPTDLTSDEFQNGVKDDYIFWRIKKGAEGGPQNSAMTGFANGTEEQDWQLVAYVRSLKGK